jgi:hypothetical protein
LVALLIGDKTFLWSRFVKIDLVEISLGGKKKKREGTIQQNGTFYVKYS